MTDLDGDSGLPLLRYYLRSSRLMHHQALCCVVVDFEKSNISHNWIKALQLKVSNSACFWWEFRTLGSNIMVSKQCDWWVTVGLEMAEGPEQEQIENMHVCLMTSEIERQKPHSI